jgi:hypothetical protein
MIPFSPKPCSNLLNPLGLVVPLGSANDFNSLDSLTSKRRCASSVDATAWLFSGRLEV